MHLVDPDTGFIAFARGRNEYLSGALCETEPQVQEFWLSCIEGMLDMGDNLTGGQVITTY